MRRKDFNQYIKENNFKELFISEMGWNKFSNSNKIVPIEVDDAEFNMKTIAERNGFQIITCPVNIIPTTTTCKKIDFKLRHYANDYICIFYIPDTEHHLWIAPVKKYEKREVITIEYACVEQTDFLFSKIDDISFDYIEDTTILDVKERIQNAFVLNSEKVTKDFYTGFKKEHNSFATFISGIDDNIDIKKNHNKQWYASVMLNRLMFCYFIQKKGFLDNDYDYLQNKLKWVQKEKGENHFFQSFYKGFLTVLFRDGLNAPKHDADFENMYGRIPYLNGGMFDVHPIEHDYGNIDIDDNAFENLFAFFDKWHWHLDDNTTSNGKEINPDILGFIFEQYINDRAQMGAYYTKGDITGYIGKNCIIPYLLDKTAEKSAEAFKEDGYVWKTLRESGDKYIYEEIKKGFSDDWKDKIPEEIAIGLDTNTPDLLKRRQRWNSKTDVTFGLTSELWRETIIRLQRCEDTKKKISNGEITKINDFITCNLDIITFAEDLIAQANDHLFVLHFYKALQNVTILDPTCGSGAFLFAAMNILEPLYLACIIRMQEFNKQNKEWFKTELEEISNKYRSNIKYFIFKSIILRNLYGVDIMVEATEIAKLRLFLKMVSVVEVDRRAENLGLDPLPDIDFNIRCGNTLVGYASEEEINRDLIEKDLFAAAEFRDKLEQEMPKIAETFEVFKSLQLTQAENMQAFKKAKKELNDRLKELNKLLNHNMYGSITKISYDKWLSTYQPFHWIAEFYQIIKEKKGFDIIIGNPPYVEFPSKDVKYTLDHLKSGTCGNLYGCSIERSMSICHDNGRFSFIVPVAITCSKRMESVINLLKHNSKLLTFANFDDRPGKLFEMIEHLRATIFLVNKANNNTCSEIYSTKYNRWYTESKNYLFSNLAYVKVSEFIDSFIIPKFSYDIECAINRKLMSCKNIVSETYSTAANDRRIYYRAAGGGYFLLFKNEKSITYIDGILEDVKAEKSISIKDEFNNISIGALLSSTLFYWNYIAYTDCRNLTKIFIDRFPINLDICRDKNTISCGKRLFKDYEDNRIKKDTYYKSTGRNVIYYEYHQNRSKNIIDDIEIAIAPFYHFTQEELDFLINYDVKFRMIMN